jgi:hypothetical protein
MVSSPLASARSSRAVAARILRFKWAFFSGIVMFLAVHWVDAWFVHHGLRRDATLLDNFLLAVLVMALVVAQQLRHERELERHRQLMEIVAEMNHHTRNALQVIVSRSVLSMPDASAIEEIRQAVARIDWCLREILPNADEVMAKQPVSPPAASRSHEVARFRRQGQ